MSAIPRLSRLPTPRSAASQCNGNNDSGRQSPPLDTIYDERSGLQSPEKQQPKNEGRTRLTRAIARPTSVYSALKGDAAQGPSQLTKTGLGTTQSRILPRRTPQYSGHGSRSSSDDIEGIARFKAARHPSQPENLYHSGDSQDESDGSTAPSSNDPTSPLNVPRKSRPSLSDRTMESLAHVPPSPAGNRRQSSFFNPQGPMTPARPSTANFQSNLPKVNHGSVRHSMIKPPSPTKKATGIPPPTSSTPAGRNINPALSKTMGVNNPTPLTAKRSSMYVKPAPTAASAIGRGGKSTHLRSATVDNGSSLPVNGTTEKPNQEKPIAAPRIKQRATAPRNTFVAAVAEEDVMASSRRISTSSAALRAQIAKAKAAARTVNSRRSTSLGPDSATYDFENCDDPFNQKPKDGKEVLQKRIVSAYKDGRLNVSTMGLKEIPEEILRMHSSEAIESSETSWAEIVDLTRLNAADNDIEKLPEEAFPDKAIHENEDGFQASSGPFGGVESVDLHGNQLKQIPSGFRLLSRLSTLNLSRNSLNNSVFDIVTQISSLRSLDLSCNDLARDLPTSISELTQLEDLDLHGNRISSVPASASTWKPLSKLRILNLSTNRLSLLPTDALLLLPSLIELHVRNNALTGALFGLSVTSVPKLQVLDVANNSIASLSFLPTLDFPSLVRLDVSANRMPLLPDMSSWTSLKSLLAEENGLDALPSGFTKLSNLRSANLRGNSIRMLEPEVGYMEKLESLIIDGNPMIRDKKFLTIGTEELKRELRRRTENTSSVPMVGTPS